MVRERLTKLAKNLYWSWNTEFQQIFHDLNPQIWFEVNHNPIEALNRLSEEEIMKKTASLALESRITRAFYKLRRYLETEDTWAIRHARILQAKPVAYFSAEFGLHESLPIYSGGLGLLAGDLLKTASDLGINMIGVGLLYAKGYFSQSLDAQGWQQEHYFEANVEEQTLELVKNDQDQPLRISLESVDSDNILIQAWKAKVGRCILVLLDTNVNENSPENRELTAQLYGGDNKIRIKQELVLGVGGIRMLYAMGLNPGVIHLNEGHSAFAPLELARILMERNGKPFKDIKEIAAGMCVFTTHTPVSAGHDRFDRELIESTLKKLNEKLGLSQNELLALGRVNPEDEKEHFCMTVLGLKMSRFRNAVSHLHSSVTRAMWKNVWHNKDEEEIPINYITNGIHLGTWITSEMYRLYARLFRAGWNKQTYDSRVWEAVDQIDDEELWETNDILLTRMIEFTRERIQRQSLAHGKPDPTNDPSRPYLKESVLTIGFARRFTPYKRSNLLLRDLDRLDHLVNNTERPVQIIFAGKAHPADDAGKKMIQEVYKVTNDQRFIGKIVFIEDYDINVAKYLVQGASLWLNTPRRPLEACGTSGMKAALNGALNISVLDGWWAEAYDGTNGFAIGGGLEHVDWEHQDTIDHESLFEVLEKEVVPMFYDRDIDGIPRQWVRFQKNALRTIPWRFSAERMVTEYTQSCYLPAVGGITSSFPGLNPRSD